LHQVKDFLADDRWHRTFEPDDFRVVFVLVAIALAIDILG